jgi:NADH-quinone oxidoreductase subunit J
MTVEFAVFLGLAVVAVAAAIAMLVSRNAVYSALFLVIVFLTIAVLFLLLSAAFIAMVQVAVYAGLFLFVVMLLGTEDVESEPGHRWQFAAALVLSYALIVQFIIVAVVLPSEKADEFVEIAEGFGSPASVGTLLFNEYLVPFEVTSLLLLAAMVGAIVLTRWERTT